MVALGAAQSWTRRNCFPQEVVVAVPSLDLFLTSVDATLEYLSLLRPCTHVWPTKPTRIPQRKTRSGPTASSHAASVLKSKLAGGLQQDTDGSPECVLFWAFRFLLLPFPHLVFLCSFHLQKIQQNNSLSTFIYLQVSLCRSSKSSDFSNS